MWTPADKSGRGVKNWRNLADIFNDFTFYRRDSSFKKLNSDWLKHEDRNHLNREVQVRFLMTVCVLYCDSTI